jgi:hypothetical protein
VDAWTPQATWWCAVIRISMPPPKWRSRACASRRPKTRRPNCSVSPPATCT